MTSLAVPALRAQHDHDHVGVVQLVLFAEVVVAAGQVAELLADLLDDRAAPVS